MIRYIASGYRRVTPSFLISVLALLVALSGTAYAIGKGEVKSRHLAPNAVKTAKIKDGAVTSPKLGPASVSASKIALGAVTGTTVADGSLRLGDLGGRATNVSTTVQNAVSVPADECRAIFLTLFNPAPPGVVGSLVVGTITTNTGQPVLDNAGYAVPTLVTETSQGGAIPYFRVCATGSPQTVPAGSIVRWSLLGT